MNPALGPTLVLLTVNTNGLGSAKRAGALLTYQQQAAGPVQAIFVQEVKQTSAAAVAAHLQRGSGAGTPWQGELAYSPGTAHSCGTAIIAPHQARSTCTARQPPATDREGRLAYWDWDVGQHRLRLVSLYAPAQPEQRADFFTSLRPLLETDRVLVIGGDFNCVLSPADEAAPSAARAAGTQQLRELMQEYGLDDPWPTHGGGTAGYTHPATAKPASAARLDRWLVSQEALPWVTSVERLPGAPADHHGVLLRLRLPDLPLLGRPGWRFPTYLLYHPALKTQLVDAVSQHTTSLAAQQQGADPRDTWEAVKAFLRSTADHIHRQHVKQCRAAVVGAQKVARAALRLQDSHPTVASIRQLADSATAAARQQLESTHHARSTAQEALYQHQGERGTRWFHSLEKQTQTQQPISALTIPGTAEPVPLTGDSLLETITAAAHGAYSSDSATGLFRIGQVDEEAQHELLQHLQRRLPESLSSAVEVPELGGALADLDLRAALGQCANGKAPGTDGLPYEVYKVLWAALGPLLLAATNAAYVAAQATAADDTGQTVAAALPPSWREGVITLIYKGRDLPRTTLGSYRPITLLNADYKIISKAISNRLQPALNDVIDPLQTAFLAGRDIRDNVLYHQFLAEWLHASGQPAALLLLDIEKAYDRVDRRWLHKTAAAMGFGPNMRSWLRLLTATGEASVIINGHRSDTFPVRNGLQQGAPLSPVLWAIQLEPLTAYLHHLVRSGLLRTPTLPDGTPAPAVSHHADDTTLVVLDADIDGPVAKAAVDLFCRASNAKENASKSKGITLGTHRAIAGTHAATGAQFLPGDSEEPPKHLGIPLSRDASLTARICFSGRLGRLKQLAGQWRRHELSMVGRAHVAKQVLGNALAFHLSYVQPTPPQLVAARRLLDGFVAWSSLPEDVSLVSRGHAQLLPKPVVASLGKEDGGIGHIDLQSYADALMAKTLAQLAQPGTRPWQTLLRALLAAAAPAGTHGWGWAYGTCPIPSSLAPTIAAYVQAYRSTQPSRFPLSPDKDNPRAVLAEPLFYNPRLLDPTNGQPFSPAAAAPPDQPRTVGQLRAASQEVRQQPQLTSIAAAIPADWKALIPPDPLTAPDLPAPDWRTSPDAAWCEDVQGSLWQVLQSGRLIPSQDSGEAPPVPDSTWEPACVLNCRKPKSLWLPAERQQYAAAPAGEKAAAWPMEPQLVGRWDSLQCYPAAHGHGKLSLIHFEVRNTRRQLTGQRAATTLGADKVPVQPAPWPDPPDPAQAEAAGPSTATSPLSRLEARWEAERPREGRALMARFVPEPQPWQQARDSPARTASAASRTARRQRRQGEQQQGDPADTEGLQGGTAGDGEAAAAMGEAAAAVGPDAAAAGPAAVQPEEEAQQAAQAAELEAEGAGQPPPSAQAKYKQAWRRLWDCPAGNRAKVLGWRLAHGRLPCGLYMAAKGRTQQASHSQGRHQHLCKQPCCAQGATQHRPRDSISHVFLTCPAYAEARQWFAELWAAVSGGEAPPTDNAALMLGDQPEAWEHHPANANGAHNGRVRLWNALRLTFLFAIWSAHQAADEQAQTAQAVVEQTVGELRRLMWAQYRTAALPDDVINALPTRLLTADLRPPPLDDFRAAWTLNDALCTVDDLAGGGTQLRMRLSLTHPVPAPGHGAE